ncbi:MAG: Mandelate racemase/muconate lactonizing protein [Myxococcales bacterium]|nr:Mandelate racemase/muconate lactonizing protein [Myxococcales bacterium]
MQRFPGTLGITRIIAVTGTPLSVPLREPFVIATGRLDATRAVLVSVTLEDETGRRAEGLGEAAALPPVTHEDQPDLLRLIEAARSRLTGHAFADLEAGEAAVAAALPESAVARAGVAAAVADAWARLAGVPLYVALGGASPPAALETDITLPIGDAAYVGALAASYRAAGFTCFKVKVGRDFEADHAALRAVAAAVPDARFRLDANAGFTARQALTLHDRVVGDGLVLECFEQPCARDDLVGMAEVAARASVPVVADESFRGAEDLERLCVARAATAVNLKLAKLGGPVAAVALGRAARARGLALMAGAMVETRVGIATMAHVVAALGGVDWVDLDTAFLLAGDPFVGGYAASGARLTLDGRAGTGVERARAP